VAFFLERISNTVLFVYHAWTLIQEESFPLQTSRHQIRALIISMLLIMVCAQSLSMHYHSSSPHDETHAHSHAHTHVVGHADLDHQINDHDDEEAGGDALATLVKQTILFGFILLSIFALLSTSASIILSRKSVPKKSLWDNLFFFQPPLRAPPL
jgi:hypothetical protein